MPPLSPVRFAGHLNITLDEDLRHLQPVQDGAETIQAQLGPFIEASLPDSVHINVTRTPNGDFGEVTRNADSVYSASREPGSKVPFNVFVGMLAGIAAFANDPAALARQAKRLSDAQ